MSWATLMSMTSDDVERCAGSIDEELSSSSPGRGGNARQQVDLAHLSKENVRLPCCQFFSERQALDNQTGRIGRLIMERETAGVLSFGAAPATKKHVDKSVVFVADAKTKSHTRRHDCHTANTLKKCVCKEGLQGTDWQEEVVVMTVLPYRRTVNHSAWPMQGDIAFSYSHEDLTVNRRHMEIQGSKESETIAKETLAQGTLTRTARKSRDHPRRNSSCERGEQTSRRKSSISREDLDAFQISRLTLVERFPRRMEISKGIQTLRSLKIVNNDWTKYRERDARQIA